MSETIFEPKFLGPFNPLYGYLVYDPNGSEVTVFCFDHGVWYWDTWIITESGSN